MLTRSERRRRLAFKRQFDSQVEQERNGAPVPADIAARMTAPKPQEVLHQVVVTDRATNLPKAIGPMVIKPVAEELCAAINAMIAAGKERTWAAPTVVPCTLIQAAA